VVSFSGLLTAPFELGEDRLIFDKLSGKFCGFDFGFGLGVYD
jgi:hypothetical protein